MLGTEKLWGIPIKSSLPNDLAMYATIIYAATRYMIRHYRAEESCLLQGPSLHDLIPLQADECRVFLDEDRKQVVKYYNT